MFDTVDDSLKSSDNLQVATTARAVKFAGSRMKTQVIQVKLLTDDLYMLQSNPDIEVKKNALEALTSVIHSNWYSMKAELRPVIGEILNFGL